ncbi:uncharacterized protein LOC143247055 [Tachypleus tridentatus]|uniref:uncharacterized protein LOC143247055 n=1 Tax=Tachypleus tridentatus TaxID=6853 RepID=UPI003FD181D3
MLHIRRLGWFQVIMPSRYILTFSFWIVLLPLFLHGGEAVQSKATDVDNVYNKWQLPEMLQKHEFPIGILNGKWKMKFPGMFSELNFINLLRHFEEEKRARNYEESLKNKDDDERKRGHTLIHFGKRNVDLRKKTGNVFENLQQRHEPVVFPYYTEYEVNNFPKYVNQQNDEKSDDEDHSKIWFRKRFESNSKDKSRSIMHFTKKSLENTLKEINKKHKIAHNVEGSKQSSGHTIMSLGKRLYSKRSYSSNELNHQMIEFVNHDNEPKHYLIHIRKRIDNDRLPDRHELLFEKNIDDERPGNNMIYLRKQMKNKQQNGHNMMYFGKRMDKEQQSGHNMMYFGKRMDKEQQSGHNMMYFGKRMDKEQQSGHNMMYFGKRMDKEQQSGHNMMYFGKRMDKEQQSGHHLTYFGERMKSEKQPLLQITYFSDEEKLPDSQMVFLGKKNNDDSTTSHQIMHFGKRQEVRDDETASDDVRVKSNSLSENSNNILQKRLRNTRYQDNHGSTFSSLYSRTSGLLDNGNNPFDYSWFTYAEDINRSKQSLSPNLEEIGENRNIGKNRVASLTDILPKVIYLFRDQNKTLKNNSYSLNHFEKRSVNMKKTSKAHNRKYDVSINPTSQSLVYSNKFDSNDKNNVVADRNEKKRNDSSKLNRVQKNTFVSDGTSSEIIDAFPEYYILPSRKDDDLYFKKRLFRIYGFFPFHLEESFPPLVTKKGQRQYPDVQYYFREDRSGDKLANERNAFLHFGKR